MKEIKIEYDDNIDVPDLYCVELVVDKRLKILNKQKWEKEKKYADKKFKRIKKEIESR